MKKRPKNLDGQGSPEEGPLDCLGAKASYDCSWYWCCYSGRGTSSALCALQLCTMHNAHYTLHTTSCALTAADFRVDKDGRLPAFLAKSSNDVSFLLYRPSNRCEITEPPTVYVADLKTVSS